MSVVHLKGVVPILTGMVSHENVVRRYTALTDPATCDPISRILLNKVVRDDVIRHRTDDIGWRTLESISEDSFAHIETDAQVLARGWGDPRTRTIHVDAVGVAPNSIVEDETGLRAMGLG